MKKIFKMFTFHKQKIDFSIEPHPNYKNDQSPCHRWLLWKRSFYSWELIGEFYTLKAAHEVANGLIEQLNNEEYEIEVFTYAR